MRIILEPTILQVTSNSADPIIFKTDWIPIRESSSGFQYLERKGKNSVAVCLIRRHRDIAEQEISIRYQHLCIDNTEKPPGQCLVSDVPGLVARLGLLLHTEVIDRLNILRTVCDGNRNGYDKT